MQAKAVTLEYIPKEILISILLFLNFKDMSNLSKTSKLWNKPFKEILENKNFDDQLTHKWIEKIKAEITSEPPQFTGYKVPQYKNFYMDNMVEKSKSNMWIFSVPRQIGAFFSSLGSYTSFYDKIKFYSAHGFDIQLGRLLKNYPGITKEAYSNVSVDGLSVKHIEAAIVRGFNKIFDVHFATLKASIDYNISTVINMVNRNTQVSLLHTAVSKANIYCVTVLLEHGGNPLEITYFFQRTCYTFALTLNSKHRNAIFKLLLDKTDKNKLKVDLSNLNSDSFQNRYGVSKSSMFLMLVQTQNDHLLARTDKGKVKADINNLGPEDFEKKYGISKSLMLQQSQNQQPLSKTVPIDNVRESTEPSIS